MVAKQVTFVLYVRRQCDVSPRGLLFQDATRAEHFRRKVIRNGYVEVSHVRQLREVA